LEIGRFIIIWKKKKHIFCELFNLWHTFSKEEYIAKSIGSGNMLFKEEKDWELNRKLKYVKYSTYYRLPICKEYILGWIKTSKISIFQNKKVFVLQLWSSNDIRIDKYYGSPLNVASVEAKISNWSFKDNKYFQLILNFF
jgi:hypothetical protein